jgi:hypothetical protein
VSEWLVLAAKVSMVNPRQQKERKWLIENKKGEGVCEKLGLGNSS